MSMRARFESLAETVLGGEGEEHEQFEADGTSARLASISGLEGAGDDMRKVGSLRGMDPELSAGKYKGKKGSRAEIARSKGASKKPSKSAAAKLEKLQAAALDLEPASDSDLGSESDNEAATRGRRAAGVKATAPGDSSAITDELVFLREQEQEAMATMSRTSASNAAQGRAAKSQVAIAETLLEGRIHMQAALAAAARLPMPGALTPGGQGLADLTASTPAMGPASAKVRQAVGGLLADLLELNAALLPRAAPVALAAARGTPPPPKVLAAAASAPVSHPTDETAQAAEDALTPPGLSDALRRVGGKKRGRAMDAAWSVLDAAWAASEPFMRSVQDAAQLRAAGGAGDSMKRRVAARKSVLNASLSDQVDGVMSDAARVARQAHPSEFGTALAAPLCMKRARNGLTAPQAERAAATAAWREEVYDDSSFYSVLLKDFVASASAPVPSGADAGAGMGGMALTAGRGGSVYTTGDVSGFKAGYKRVVRDVDRRASKGRRVRYAIHPKLTGFMAPAPLVPPVVPGTGGDRFAVDTDVLVRSLFQSA